MKSIFFLISVALFYSCGGHSNKSVPESAKVGATVVGVSPVILIGGSSIGGRKITQKSAIATKAPAKWYAEEVTGERLRALMIPTGKITGKWSYMGSRGIIIFFHMRFWGGIYTVC
jgi:hypothetical protein